MLSNEVNEKIRLLKTFESKETFDIAQFLPFIIPLLSTLSNKNLTSLVESLIDLFLNKSFLKEFEINDIKNLIPKFEKLIKELSSQIEKRN